MAWREPDLHFDVIPQAETLKDEKIMTFRKGKREV